jgi:cell wall-associated NlpC family hydrolase
VASLEQQVTAAVTRIGRARVALAALNVQAESAFETYDGARVKLATARRAVGTAHQVLAGANHQVALGEAQIARFARAAYESGGLSTIDAYLAPGGAARLVSRVGAVAAISTSEHTTLERLDAARIYRGVVSRQAQSVAGTAAADAAVARRAKAAALAAVNRQQHFLAGIRAERSRLHALLGQAKGRAARLEREHLVALARARAAAEARAAAAAAAAAASAAQSAPSPFVNTTGSTAGTVSAATEVAALHEAQAQIGKPYQWGGAGPDTFDCSGLVMWSYDQVGVHLDHWTGYQWVEGAHIARGALRPGDLVFFAYNTSDPSTIHHVGMYVGGGEMVDAPFTGADVRYDSMDRPDYIGAVRPYQR